MIYKDTGDIAMTYENLVRAVFDCDRFEGPENCANADVYHEVFVPETNEKGERIMKYIIDKILDDNKEAYSEEIKDALLDIRSRMNNVRNQGEAIDAIHDLIDLLNANGY